MSWAVPFSCWQHDDNLLLYTADRAANSYNKIQISCHLEFHLRTIWLRNQHSAEESLVSWPRVQSLDVMEAVKIYFIEEK